MDPTLVTIIVGAIIGLLQTWSAWFTKRKVEEIKVEVADVKVAMAAIDPKAAQVVAARESNRASDGRFV